jgi:16S rRNA U516 pseudouridylate synthase RsuA-like enzyme
MSTFYKSRRLVLFCRNNTISYSLYIALHKPRGYVTSRARDAETKIIYDLLPVRLSYYHL